MKSRLVNVRLDEHHVRKANALRKHGVVLSELVREAIDARFEAIGKARPERSARSLVDDLFARFPDDGSELARAYDVHDAAQARAAVRSRLAGPKPER